MGVGARRAVAAGLMVLVLLGAPAALWRWGAWPLDGGDSVAPGIATVVGWGLWGQFALGLVRPRDDDPLRRVGRALLRPGPRRPVAEAPPPVTRLDEILSRAKVVVRVLGEVDAVEPDPASPHRELRVVPARQKVLEALAYLALSESGPADVLSDYGIFCDLDAAARLGELLLAQGDASGAAAAAHRGLLAAPDDPRLTDLVGQAEARR